MKDKQIAAGEILNEMWTFYFTVLKGLLLTIAGVATLAAMMLLFVAQRVEGAAHYAQRWVRVWTPMKPAIFEFKGDL